jgi:hypothetical protein
MKRGIAGALAATGLVLLVLACSGDRQHEDEHVGSQQAALGTAYYPYQDSYLRQGSPNQNQGSLTYLRLEQSGKNRAVVAFDLSNLHASFSSITSATLSFSIVQN